MPVPESFLYLTEHDVQQAIEITQAIELAHQGILADSAHNVVGDKFYTAIGDAGFVKPFTGYIADEEYFFVKTFNFFQGNPAKFNLPTTSSLVLLFDAQTGFPVCIMEAAWVTGLKTAASTAVTAQYLANKDSKTLVVFGAGLLGRMHLLSLGAKFPLNRAYVIDINPDAAQTCLNEIGPQVDFPILAVHIDDRESVVRKADLILTVTTGNQPLIEYAWLKPGAFIARLGSYQEISPDVITRSDKVIVDNWHYISPRIPELVNLIEGGRFSRQQVAAEWPQVVAGTKPGRETADEIIVYIALGIWGEYAAILPEIYRRAKSLGLGTRLPSTYYVS
jgi:ornithine cyclodeaminase/alanine dehydrogenase-like protein (mu-crystallin family)